MSIDRKNNIVYGQPEPEKVYAGAQSLAEFLHRRLVQHGHFPSVTDALASEVLTASQLRIRAIRVADCLRELGVTDDDTVLFCSENRLELAIVLFGTMLLGATGSPVSSVYSARELHHAVQIAKPKVIFGSSSTVDNIVQVASQIPSRPTIILLDDVPASNVYTTYRSLISNTKVKTDVNSFKCKSQNVKDKVALLLFSSGTTGLPKAVQLTDNNIVVALVQYEIADDSELKQLVSEKIVLSVGPWSHAFGCMGLIGLVVCGEKLIYLPKFVDRDYLAAIQKFKINLTHCVPPLVVFLAKHPLVSEYDLSSLKMVGCGAAPLSKETEDAMRARIGVPLVRQGYGMTESTLTICSQSKEICKSGSVGALYPGLSGRVVDVETGKNLGPNQRGEMQFRGSTIMKGYLGDEAATRQTIDEDGWLHTGDIGYYDERGEWFIVDRLKELIKYNGFQVPPAEIEGLLLQHPLISDAGVIGVPDERFGELPLAFVVKQAVGQHLTEQDVIQFVAERTSRPKQLHGGVQFVAAIPKNPSGKILRKDLRELIKNKQAKL